MFAVIVENDESQWSDDTGVHYHFPKRYLKHLSPGTQVMYYKGRIKDPKYKSSRLSSDPHYFGIAEIDQLYPDKKSSKSDYFATLRNVRLFHNAVLAKQGGEYLETIPDNRKSNYWRDGVRPIDRKTYESIVALVDGLQNLAPQVASLNDDDQRLESLEEGNKQVRYVTTYERDPKLRKQAIAIHGVTCVACGTNFGEIYGPYAEGLIHIHHVIPVSEFGGSKTVNPETDLVPVCANCHAVIHRRKDKTLSIVELKSMMVKAN